MLKNLLRLGFPPETASNIALVVVVIITTLIIAALGSLLGATLGFAVATTFYAFGTHFAWGLVTGFAVFGAWLGAGYVGGYVTVEFHTIVKDFRKAAQIRKDELDAERSAKGAVWTKDAPFRDAQCQDYRTRNGTPQRPLIDIDIRTS